MGELIELLDLLFRRYSLVLSVGAAAFTWWFWPWLRPPVTLVTDGPNASPDVVAVEITDPEWTRAALNVWRARPGALLALMAPGEFDESRALIRAADLSAEQRLRVVVIDTCGDTLTEIADLSNWLGKLRRPGQLQLVTSEAHIEGMTSVAQVMLGGRGWRVEGVPAFSGAVYKPESSLELIRDHLRSQVWRATGWTGKTGWICPGRSRGLF